MSQSFVNGRFGDGYRGRVLEAFACRRKMLHHDNLSPDIVNRIKEEIELFGKYLASPSTCSEADVSEIQHLAPTFKQMASICHSDKKGLGDMMKAARAFAYQVACPESQFCPTFHEIMDYTEFLLPLSDILRCRVCFGNSLFNQIDQRTGLQYSWSDIGEVLEADTSFPLPLNYHSGHMVTRCDSSLSHSNLAPRIVQSVRNAAESMGCDYEDIAWQIIFFSVSMEQNQGPKYFVRTDRWESLVIHTATIIQHFKNAYLSKGLLCDAARIMQHVVQSVQSTWFSRVIGGINSPPEYDISEAAVKLDARLASSGNALTSPGYRRFPLANEGILFPLMQPKMVDPFKRYVDDDSPSQEKFGGFVPGPDAIVLEPIPRYNLDVSNYLGDERIVTISMYIERLQTITSGLNLGSLPRTAEDYFKDHRYLTLSDLNCAVLVAIRTPALYSDKFLRETEQFAGMDDEILKTRDIYRIQGRGFIRFQDLEGLIPKYGRNNLGGLVAKELAELRDKLWAGETIEPSKYSCFPNFEPIIPRCVNMDDHVRHVISALMDHVLLPPVDPNEPGAKRSQCRQDTRRVDLVLALRFLVRLLPEDFVWRWSEEHDARWTTKEIEAVVANAGAPDHVLDVKRLARVLGLGIIPGR